MADKNPRVVIVFSGKRKSGKDYITEKLCSTLGDNMCTILRLSVPLKAGYAAEHGLDFQRLLDSSEYKEFVRKDMIEWGEKKRNTDYKYFCKLAVEEAYKTVGSKNCTSVWVVSDARRRTDLKFFRDQYNVLHTRVTAADSVRVARGWIFTTGVDDAASECDLDHEVFDHVLENNGDEKEFEKMLTHFKDMLHNELGPQPINQV